MHLDRMTSERQRRRSNALPRVELLEGRELMTVQIVGKSLVADTAGSITLTLKRTRAAGEQLGAEAVAVDTVAGTAVAGVDYSPVHQVIPFAPGVRTEGVTIPIFPDAQNAGTLTFSLTVNDVPSDATPSLEQSAVISIIHRASTQLPPRIKSTLLLTSGNQVTGFVINFDQDMAPGPVADVGNYNVHLQQAGSPTVPLLSAVYNPARHAVTLVPAQPVPAGNYVVQNPGPSQQSPLTDTAGVALDGVGDRTPNAILYALFVPKGPTLSPVYKAQLSADQRIHEVKKGRRGDTLGETPGDDASLLAPDRTALSAGPWRPRS